MIRKLTCITDPGHGWLSVSQQDLIALDIVDKISRFSYMNRTRAYLEEDCDAAIYLEAARSAGWQVELKTSTNKSTYNNLSSVRNLSCYKPYFVRNPINVGSKVFVYDDTDEYEVVEMGRWWIITNVSNRYRLSKDNPYNSIYGK